MNDKRNSEEKSEQKNEQRDEQVTGRPEPDAAELERLARAKAERERERDERERAAREQVDREERERERRARERVFTERMDRDRRERERLEREVMERGAMAREEMGRQSAARDDLPRQVSARDEMSRQAPTWDDGVREASNRDGIREVHREGAARDDLVRADVHRTETPRVDAPREALRFELPEDIAREPTREAAREPAPVAAREAARETVRESAREPLRREPGRIDELPRDDMHRVSHGDIPAGVQQSLYEAERSQGRRRMLLVVFLIALAAAAYWGWLEWQKRQAVTEPVATAPAPSKQEAQPAGPPPIQHPIAPTNEPLPALADSDAAVTKALGDLVGAGRLADVIVPGNVVRKIVASVDNAGRQQLYTRTTPLKPPPSKFMTSGTGDARTINPRNSARYAIYAQVVEQVDAQKFATTYQRFYPLFQQAYEELGYPGRYFNDRLVEVIDLMLATPDTPAAPTLIQPKINYEYADPRLESLTAGQKALIRMGPTESARIKVKLREIRAAITSQPGAASSTASSEKGG